MVFSSTVFLFLFLPLTLVVYYNPFFRGRPFRNGWLLTVSLVFYAWGEPLFVFLMLFSILVTWKLALRLEKAAQPERKRLLTALISFHVLLLFIFKYLTFLAAELGLLLQKDGSSFQIALPIGISFFTFQLMSYAFDVYYEKARAQKSFSLAALYIALFPQLIAGPIVRYGLIYRELLDRRETAEDVAFGMQRFICGLAKKVLLANYMAQIADGIFGAQEGISVLTAWLGAAAYTLQIYFDFSGYSDMAIGLGRMFGFHFPENFRYPYAARTVTDFWRRWHMTLTGWFRDYVYIPLGGNRAKKSRWVGNLFAVWALTGFWHGANWTFLCWGMFYFAVLLAEKTTGFAEKLGWFSRVYTLLAVMVAWVMFRAENCAAGMRFIGAMFGFGAAGFSDATFDYYLRNGGAVLLVAALLCFPIWPALRERFSGGKMFEAAESVCLCGLFVLSLLQAISSTYNPFIYFNF